MKELRMMAVLLLSPAWWACLSAGEEWGGVVSDSAGVVLVANPDQGTWAEGGGWRLEEDLRIGSLDAEPAYQFGQIGARGIAVGSDEAIYVLDGMAQEIRVFTASGEYVRTIGGPGGGPGEIGPGAQFLLMGSADTLLVPDMGNQRITWYDTRSEEFGSERLELQKGIPMVFTATASGAIVGQVRPLGLPNQPAADSMDTIVLMAGDGTPIDTLMRFESGQSFSFGGGRPEIKIFSPEPAWDVTEHLQVVYGMNDDYRVGVYGADGQLERVISKPFSVQPVEESDKELVLDFLRKAWVDAGVPQQVLPQLIGSVEFGEHYPAFGRVVVGPQGTIMVQRIQPPGEMTEEERENYNFLEDAGSRHWDVFSEEGRYFGVLSFPARFQPRIFKEGMIYGVWRDELDVQHVMRLRLLGLTA